MRRAPSRQISSIPKAGSSLAAFSATTFNIGVPSFRRRSTAGTRRNSFNEEGTPRPRSDGRSTSFGYNSRLLAITRSVVLLSLLGRVDALQLLVVPVPLLSRHGRARVTYVTIPTSSGTSRPAAWHFPAFAGVPVPSTARIRPRRPARDADRCGVPRHGDRGRPHERHHARSPLWGTRPALLTLARDPEMRA